MQDETKPSPQNEEIENQTAAPQSATEGQPVTPDELIARLVADNAALVAERDQMKDQLLRAMAETENTRRRVERERAEAIRYAPAKLLRDLVKVADNLARALAAVPPEAAEANEQVKILRDGVALTERELLTAFQRNDVAKIEPLGEPLDPNFHEAMFEIPTAEAAPGTVVQVLESGWKLHDRLIRPARVAVAKAP